MHHGGGHRPDAPMREQPSADMIDERLAAWQAGDYPEGWSVYDALGWSRDEYMTWLNGSVSFRGKNTRCWTSSMFQTYKLLCFAPKADRTGASSPCSAIL